MWFISGVWFEQKKRNRIGLEVSSEGTTKIESDLQYFRFMGWFQMPISEHSKPFGEMHDNIGQSFLVDISITDLTLSFTKRYNNEHGTVIYCELKKEDDEVWEGSYIGPGVRGTIRCVLMEVSDTTFLTPPQ
jgi:hypothetical protein